MQFNPGDGSGIVDEINSLCDSDNTSYTIADKTRRVNTALDTLIGKILTADGTWQFDDSNYTNLPIVTYDLTEGQSSYSFDDEFLDVLVVKVKDANGHWHVIDPVDQSMTHVALEEFLIVNGMPFGYDKIASDTIKLFPAPAATVVTLTGGLKIEFQRKGSPFTTADTTKEPGIASPFHILIAQMAALPYCKTYKKDRVPQLQLDIQNGTNDLLAFYGQREKDKRKVMTTKRISFR